MAGGDYTPEGDIWYGATLSKQIIQYTPTTTFFGIETFTYTITDVRGVNRHRNGHRHRGRE